MRLVSIYYYYCQPVVYLEYQRVTAPMKDEFQACPAIYPRSIFLDPDNRNRKSQIDK